MRPSPTIVLLVALSGCSIDQAALGEGDAGAQDGVDAGGMDASPPDAGRDGGPVDPTDAAQPDTGPGPADDAGPLPDGGCEASPALGMPCDGPDDDLCPEGNWECDDGGLVCSDDTGLTIEICNETDDDCDGEIDEDAHDAITWYADEDGDGYGVTSASVRGCEAPADHADTAGDCDDDAPDVNPDASEVCNAVDDDCDGTIDDPTACGCAVRERGGHVYLFCNARRSWTSARDYCAERSYALATVDDEAENGWITDTALAIADEPWWIGLSDRGSEGSFVWVDGSGSTYRNWASGQPNDWFGQDCVNIERGSDRARWGDAECDESKPSVCEAVP